MRRIIYFIIGLIIILVLVINYDSFVRNPKLAYEEESTDTAKDNSSNSADILNKDTKTKALIDNDMNNDSNTDLNGVITEILSKVNEAHNEIKYFNSEIYIIINDKDDNIENIKVDILNDVDNSANYFQVNDLNLNTVPIKAYYLQNTLYEYNNDDNKWIIKENINDVSIKYKDFNIDINFDISEFLDIDTKNLQINEGLSNEKYIVLGTKDNIEYDSEEGHLISKINGTIWIERETYYINRVLLENSLFEEESKTLLQEFKMDMKVKEINKKLEIKLPKELENVS